MTALAPPSRRLPFQVRIDPPDHLIRALLVRDGFVERFGSPLGRAPIEMELPSAPGWVERVAAWVWG